MKPYPKLTHQFCQNPDCRICLREHLYLGEFLREQIGNNREDWLGKIHWFIGKNAWCRERFITPNTIYGWAHPAQFRKEVLDMFIRWAKAGCDGDTAPACEPHE